MKKQQKHNDEETTKTTKAPRIKPKQPTNHEDNNKGKTTKALGRSNHED